MYVSSADLLSIPAQDFSMLGGYTEDLKKNAKLHGGAWVLAQDNTVYTLPFFFQ